MSSHKEAPGISFDPAADNTDVYAFVSTQDSNDVVLIANYLPFETPAGGPNFYEFGDDVLYQIHVDNDGDGLEDISFRFRFSTELTHPDSFLYNVGPIESIDSDNWNRRQFAHVSRLDHGSGKVTELGGRLACPPCNVGPFSTPHYERLAHEAVHDISGGRFFAGQRADGFYVDIGSIFDLGDLRPFQSLHVGSMLPNMPGVNGLKALNVQTIALQLRKTQLTAGGRHPSDPTHPRSTIGVWATASRQHVRMFEPDGDITDHGRWVQVSRLGNPLFNEVLIPIARKDYWNAQVPAHDKQFARYVAHPELARLLPALYPGVFPHLEALVKSGKPRADLEAILLTGIPAGIITGFQNFTGHVEADMLRLNLAIPPTQHNPSNLGLLGMDLAGFPNGRRVFDDVTTIELRAIAGATYPLVDNSFTPDPAAGELTQGLTSSSHDKTAKHTVHFLSTFPYLGTPHSGFYNPPNDKPAPAPPK